MSSGPAVEFFYYCSCPWTWLAFGRLHEAALRTGSTIVYRPILLEWLPGVSRTDPPPIPNAARAKYAVKDLQDWARFCGVTIRPEEELPSPSVPEWAQRGALVAVAEGLIRPYADAIFAARFAELRDIRELAVVEEIAAAAGLSGVDFRTRLEADETWTTVRRNSEELVRRGGFGSPTMFVGDDMYFGNDRMPLVESALMRAMERPFIAPGEHGR